MTRHAEISGAGLVGLVAGAALARRGWTVRIHEREPALREFGAGIFLWDNGLRSVRAVGGVLGRVHEAPYWEDRDGTGRLLSEGQRPLPRAGDGYLVTMTRRDLYAAVLASARQAGVEIHTGSKVVHADPLGDITTEDGRTWRADLVIGADGIRSRIRESQRLTLRSEELPFVIHRFLVPLAAARATHTYWQNYVDYRDTATGRRVLYAPCNSDDLYLLLGAHPSDVAAVRQPLDAATWRESFPALSPVLTTFPTELRVDRYEAVHTRSWSRGRVVVLGDAAHAMPPTLGRGAGTGMANAVALADALERHPTVEEALAAWEAARRRPTEQIQEQSLQLAHAVISRRAHPDQEQRC